MSSFSLRPLTSTIGAEIDGLDIASPLSSEDRQEVLDALVAHHVLFFREQDITPEQQVAFAKQFGPISFPPFAPKYGTNPEYIVLDQENPKGEGADAWHSDNSFMSEPPMGSVLRAVLIPEVGGDTCFASTVAAYDALSPSIQRLVDGLKAIHDITKPLLKGIAAGHTTVNLEDVQAQWPPVAHPIVRTHPITGKKSLYVNRNSTTHIEGLSERENEMLLPFLMDHIRSPEFQCRFKWDTNSVAFWDNRSAQHFAVSDYHSRRIMNRVTIAGEKVL